MGGVEGTAMAGGRSEIIKKDQQGPIALDENHQGEGGE